MSDMLLIKGGRVIDPVSGFDETADVLIADGVVREIGRVSPPPDLSGTKQLDAEGCIVAPGLLDIHVHFRDPGPDHEETVTTGLAGAVAGGFTTVCCMPNTKPALDSVDIVLDLQARAEAADLARLFIVACATRDRAGELLAPMKQLNEAGIVAFSDDGDVIADDAIMQQVLQTAKSLDSCVMQHCQEPSMTIGASMHAGVISTKLGLVGWPREAEETIIERDVALNADIGCRYHAQHLSSGGSVDIIRRAQKHGQPVTGECSPHHLLLTDQACDGYNTMAKMNPPLRTQRDIDQLKAGIAEGIITVLATDHAPHPMDRKALDFESAPFGIVGVECALPLYKQALIDDGVLDWPQMLAMMTINPARLVGLDKHGLGLLREGGPGDVTVIDPHLAWAIDPEVFKSAGRNCPFAGWQVTGRAAATIVSGRVRHRDKSSAARSPKSVSGSRT